MTWVSKGFIHFSQIPSVYVHVQVHIAVIKYCTTDELKGHVINFHNCMDCISVTLELHFLHNIDSICFCHCRLEMYDNVQQQPMRRRSKIKETQFSMSMSSIGKTVISAWISIHLIYNVHS